jgi:hypothetical protein
MSAMKPGKAKRSVLKRTPSCCLIVDSGGDPRPAGEAKYKRALQPNATKNALLCLGIDQAPRPAEKRLDKRGFCAHMPRRSAVLQRFLVTPFRIDVL